MAAITLHKVIDNWVAQLNASVSSSATSFVLKFSGANGAPSVPFYATVDSEVVEVTDVQQNTPSSALDTLTVVRGQLSTDAEIHDTNSLVENLNNAAHITELQYQVEALRGLVAAMLGDSSGVQRVAGYDTTTSLNVRAQSTPDMTVRVAPGSCVVGGQPVALTAETNSAMITAPVTNPRIDVIQIDQSGNVEVVTGTEAVSPSAPSVDSDALKLAEIALAIDTASITSVEITDGRVFL